MQYQLISNQPGWRKGGVAGGAASLALWRKRRKPAASPTDISARTDWRRRVGGGVKRGCNVEEKQPGGDEYQVRPVWQHHGV